MNGTDAAEGELTPSWVLGTPRGGGEAGPPGQQNCWGNDMGAGVG